MFLKEEANAVTEQIIDALVAYGELDLNLKRIWSAQIIKWLAANPDYNEHAHARFDPLSFYREQKLDGLLNIMKDCIKEKKPYIPPLPEKQKTYQQLFGEFSKDEKIQSIREWLTVGRTNKKQPKLPDVATEWAKKQDDKLKELLKKPIGRNI